MHWDRGEIDTDIDMDIDIISQARIKIAGKISAASDRQMIPL